MNLTSHEDAEFRRFVDDMIIANTDPDFANGIRWIEKQAIKSDMGFYEMAFIVLKKHVTEKRAKEWNAAR